MYNGFARFYDILMQDALYEKRADYIEALFNKYSKMPALLLDLACGTGGFSLLFSKKGCSVIGVDKSEDMLAVAYENRGDNDIMYLCQDMTELDLYGTVDGCISCLDSINHITDYNDLCRAFGRVSLFSEKGSLFIFDVNTPYKHEFVLGDNSFVFDGDEVFLSWQNFYDPSDKTVDIALDFFEKRGKKYERFSDNITERAYTENELKTALDGAGFEVLAVYGDMTFEAPCENEERVYYVARKR